MIEYVMDTMKLSRYQTVQMLSSSQWNIKLYGEDIADGFSKYHKKFMRTMNNIHNKRLAE
jgi:hypothetical protein